RHPDHRARAYGPCARGRLLPDRRHGGARGGEPRPSEGCGRRPHRPRARGGRRRLRRLDADARRGPHPPRGVRDRPAPRSARMQDPVTFDICWSRLVGVVNEQAAALQRTSFTSIVREAGDLSAGVFDRRGWMLAQAVNGTPGHINSMALCLRHMLAAIPVETLRPGDVLITNDPWKGSGHLNDVTIATPVFRGEG